jgi:hypothetical protein
VKGIRIPTLRGGWLKTEVGKITKRRRAERERDRVFIANLVGPILKGSICIPTRDNQLLKSQRKIT